jgi:integrase
MMSYINESRTLGLDRMELGSVIQAARASSPSDSALIALMGMLGLRVSEACAVTIEDYQDIERGHRELRLVGKGGEPPLSHCPSRFSGRWTQRPENEPVARCCSGTSLACP